MSNAKQASIRMTYGQLSEAWGALCRLGGPGRAMPAPKAQALYRMMLVIGRHYDDAERVRRQLRQIAQDDPSRIQWAARQMEALNELEVELGVTPLPADFFDGASVEPGALYALGPLYDGWICDQRAELPEQLRALVPAAVN